MTSIPCLLLLLLSVAAHGVAGTWEYSVVCPPGYNPNGPQDSQCDVILLAGDEPATVNISTAHSTHPVIVQRQYRWTATDLPVDGGIEDKGILITSDVPISVHLAQVDRYYTPQIFNEATGIPSVSEDQTSFHIVNHVDAPFPCSSSFRRNDFFAISPSQDNTLVTVTSPTSSSSSFSSSFTLDLYETFSEIAESNSIELSGYKINSSAPITVVSGNLCTYNFVGSTGTGAYITSHHPVEQYSTQYVVPAIEAPYSSGYDVHVVASTSNTLVTIDGQVELVQADEIFVQPFPSRTNVTLISCSRPCNVVQFTQGSNHYDGMFAINVIPTNEFYTRAVFTTSEENIDHHITVIVASPTAVSDILLDGAVFDPVWSTAGASFIYATANVSEGYHVMTSTDSLLAVYTYASTGYDAGGYGFAVLPAEDEIRTTSVSPEPTTVPPTTPGTSLPRYSITTNGTLVTDDDVTPVCVLYYNDEMDQQAKTMTATIDALIGREICTNQMPGDVLIKSAFVTLQFSANQAEVYVVYSLDVHHSVRGKDVEECAGDIAWYVSVGEHWPDPILPGTQDCPPMGLNPNYFQLIASRWICPQTEDMEKQSASDNILLYEMQVGDVMDTEDGSELPPACTAAYSQDLIRQAVTLTDRLRAMMDSGEMCENNQTIAELTPFTSLAAVGAQVYYTVTMVTQPGPDARFGEFLDCAFVVHTYLRTVSNWPSPPLPPQPGCPALITDTELLEDRGSGWSCIDKN